MVSFNYLAAALLAGTALAAPAPNHRRGGRRIIWKTLVKTEYVTVWPGMPKETPKTSVVVAKPTTTVEAPKEEPTVVAPPKESSYVVITPTPTPTLSPKPAEPAPTKEAEPAPAPEEPKEEEPAATGYMAIVDEWRARLGKGKLTWSAKLEANARDTVIAGNGKMVHKLNSGTFGQVLAPGGPEDFYHCFVGGWLCERPDMPGMDGVCATASKGWYYTTTGHADILSSDNYKEIGCANEVDIWSCDVA